MPSKFSPLASRIATTVCTVAVLGWGASAVRGASDTWKSDAAGNWSDGTLWVSGTPPGTTAGDTANLTFNLATSRAITIDGINGNRTLGTLNIGDSNITNTYNLTASGGGLLIFDNSGSGAALNQTAGSNGDTISAPILLADSLTITNSSPTKTLTLSAGITSSLGSTKTITIGGTAAGGVTISGAVGPGSGNVAIVKNNANNTLILSGANTFTGGVTLNAGTLSLNSATALGGAASVLTITGGTLAALATGITISTNNLQNWNGDFGFGGTGNLNLGTGAATMSANRTITIGSNGKTLTVGGEIKGVGFSLSTANVAGAGASGILLLSGPNSYDGGTNINGGVVRFENAAAIPTTGTILIQSGGALAIAGARTSFTAWFADTRLSQASTGALAMIANSAAAFDPGAAGFNNLSLGVVVGTSATYTGTYTPSSAGYFVGGGGGTLTFSNANAFTGAQPLTVGNGGGGTVIVSSANNYTGPTTITAGTLQLGAGGTTGSIDNTPSVTNNGTLAFNRTDAVTFGVSIGGTGGVTQNGTGSVTLGAANTYSGPTTISKGTLKAGAVGSIPTGNVMIIGTTGPVIPTVIGAAGAFDTNGFDVNLSSLSFITSAIALTNTVTITAGKTLTVATAGTTGGLKLGIPGTTGILTNATFNGGGALVVNTPATTLDVGFEASPQNTAPNNGGQLDLTALSSFSATVTELRVGYGSLVKGTLLLSNTANTVIANSIQVSHSNGSNADTGQLTLGAGTNILQADTFNIGRSKGIGTISFAQQDPGSPGTVTITNKADTATGASLIIGSTEGTGTGASLVGKLDLRGHVATVKASTIVLGRRSDAGTGGTTGETALGELYFDGGTLTATTIIAGDKSSSSANLASVATGNIYVSAGSFTVGTLNMAPKTSTSLGSAVASLNISGGTVTVNTSFKIASQATAGTAQGSVTITGGILSSKVDIVDGAGATTTMLTLDGGTLDLNGKFLGGFGAAGIDTLNLRSGVLMNVAQINGGATLQKTTGGTLTLAGTNAYTGTTQVDAGTVLVSGSLTGTPTVNVNTAATLGGTGTIGTTATQVKINAGGSLAPGTNGVGTLTLGTAAGNSLAFTGTSLDHAVFRLELNASNNTSDLLALKGNLDLSNAFDELSFTILNGTLTGPSYTLLTYTGTRTGTFDFTTAIPAGYTLDYGTGSNSAITLVAVPEPGAWLSLMGSLGMLTGLRRFRRRG